MKLLELIGILVIFSGLLAFTSQDVAGKKGCDCSICQGVNNRIHPIVGKNYDGGKPGCNICEKKKEMLRKEKERQQQLQKCPFEILGSPAVKGKDSEEIFDEFRELIVPSQNGFFDMMRGIVKTMHVTSVAELKYAKEKEAKELAKKKAEEAAKRKAKHAHSRKEEIVDSPKVTVVVKQQPCGQFVAPEQRVEAPIIPFVRRLPKETVMEEHRMEEELIPNLQLIHETPTEEMQGLNDDLFQQYHEILSPDEKPEMNDLFQLTETTVSPEEINNDLVQQSITTLPPEENQEMNNNLLQQVNATLPPEERPEMNDVVQSSETTMQPVEATTLLQDVSTSDIDIVTESSFIKYMSNDEFKALSGQGNTPADDLEIQLNELAAQTEWGLLGGVGEYFNDGENLLEPSETD